MALYHFHIDDGTDRSQSKPVALESIKHARLEAVRTLGDLITSAPDIFWDSDGWRMTVTNNDHLTLFEIMIVATDAPAARR